MNGRGLGISMPTTALCSINTIGQLLRQSKYTIMLALDPILTYEEVEIFFERVCSQCAPKPSRVLQLFRATTKTGNAKMPIDTDCVTFGNQMRQLPTSLPSLDRILGGGVRLASVTELVGRSGVGKTQLAFQLCITAAKFNQGAIYIDTEKKLSLERLGEMSEQRRVHNENDDTIGSFKPGEIVLDNLTLHQPGNSEELLQVLDELEYEILIRNQKAGGMTSEPDKYETNDRANTRSGVVHGKYPVRLLIVDSIAAPMRRDFGSDSAPQRAAMVFQCAQKLKRLADQLHMAVVVINQVGSGEGGVGASNPSNDAAARDFGSEHQHHAPMRAALGTSWHHCVSTRLSLETRPVDAIDRSKDSNGRTYPQQETMQSNFSSMRKIAVTKSNKIEYGETYFKITTMGVVEV